MFFQQQAQYVQNAGIERHISGARRQEVLMRQRQDFSSAQNASIPGESIGDFREYTSDIKKHLKTNNS